MLDHTLYPLHSINTDPAVFDPAPARGSVQFWFSLTTPFAYLMAHRLASTVRRFDVSSVWIPVCLSNAPRPPEPTGCRRREIADTARMWNLTFHWPDVMPARAEHLNAIALAAFENGIGIEFCLAVMAAIFARNVDLNHEMHVHAILRRHLPEAAIEAVLTSAASPRIQANIDRIDEMAANYGLTGAPVIRTYRDVFWTHDRLEEALASVR